MRYARTLKIFESNQRVLPAGMDISGRIDAQSMVFKCPEVVDEYQNKLSHVT